MATQPTLYDNFTRVKNWAIDKFADKETLASTLSDVAFSGEYGDLLNKPDLSTYVTKTELSNAGYLTSVPNTYPTYAAISAMSYATETYVTNAIAAIPGTDLTGYATESYVTNKIEALVNSAPDALDTLEELANALGDDPNFATTITNELAKKIDSSYVYTKNEINSMSYVSTSALNTRLNTAGYISSIPAEYITETELSGMGYISSIPSEYITQTELSGMSYLTAIPSEYITESELSLCGYTVPLTESQMDALFPVSA